MTTETLNSSHLVQALDALRQEVARLGERVAALEKLSAPPAATAAPAAVVEEVNDELLVILSAAVAAFLGKRAPIRQIRLVGSTAWAQQGRATIQASHG